MAERPLLIFPTPEKADRTKLGSGWPRLHLPSHDGQSARLTPIFNSLQSAFEARRVEIQAVTSGIEPEQVLVIETIGGVDKFANAIKKISGLEWMGELVDEFAPDAEFFPTDKLGQRIEGDSLDGRIYFVMASQRALGELLSLWQSYQQNKDFVFQKGLAKFREVFKHLKNIRTWGIQDRFEETGVIEDWKNELSLRGTEPVRFEIELWYRRTSTQRQASQQQIATSVSNLNGRILSQCDIEGIGYHALLVELPANSIQTIIDNHNIELIKCDDIMFFRPRGQISAGKGSGQFDVDFAAFAGKPLPTGEPVIALLDGLPLANHQLLSQRLRIEDPDNLAAGYQASEHIHGTAMASLIIHGDLNSNNLPLPTPIYVRPVMKPVTTLNPPRCEEMPDDVLAVDIIHRAVRCLFEADAGQPPSAPTVRIVNFSICDYHRQFSQTMSPMGRLIDWLSAKYNILFILSAGNHGRSINLGIPFPGFNNLPANEREAAVVRAVTLERSHRKLLSPAESINALTVGSSHNDNASVPQSQRIDPYQSPTNLPSPISAFGSGYRRGIKPDLVFSGGRQFYEESFLNQNQIQIVSRTPSAPGNKVAFPGSSLGQISGTSYCCGTSNATALISRTAGFYHELLAHIFDDNGIGRNSPFIPPIIKAMLVHGCSWGDIGDRIDQILGATGDSNQIVTNWIGYGIPDINRLMECTAQRASLIGFGELSNEKAHVFKLPLPPTLGSRLDWRKLTITLAWISPTAPSTQKYRGASLWFDKVDTSLITDRIDMDWHAARRGTVQHEIFTGTLAAPITDGDSLEIKINCREDGAKIVTPVRYGLVVSLEVTDGIDINIYNEIRSRITVPVETDI